MSSWHGNAFRIADRSLRGIGGFPHKAHLMLSFGVFFVFSLDKLLTLIVELPVICDAITLMWRHRNGI